MLTLQNPALQACARSGGDRVALMARPDKQIWAVAQAIGQHSEANWAAATVVQQLEIALNEPATSKADQLFAGIEQANSLLLRAAAIEQRPVQSAVAALGFTGNTASGFWIGNCRIYRLRQNVITLLSEDHDLASSIENRGLVEISDDEREGLSRVLTRAIGSSKAPQAERFVEKVHQGDRYLICGAGLARKLSDAEIARQLSRGTPREAIDRLQGLFLSRGGIPNFGAIAIDAPTHNNEQTPL